MMDSPRYWYRFLIPLVIIVSLLIIFINRDNPDEQVVVSPEDSAQARNALIEWLECVECLNGQLDAVLKQADLLKPMLIATLNKGLSPAAGELYRRFAQQQYNKLLAYNENLPDSRQLPSEEEYIQRHLGRLDYRFRIRAAQALGAMGNHEALEAISASTQSEELRSGLDRILNDAIKARPE